jgi:hypothetical protein
MIDYIGRRREVAKPGIHKSFTLFIDAVGDKAGPVFIFLLPTESFLCLDTS